MRVTLIAATKLTPAWHALAGRLNYHPSGWGDMELLTEFSGRACYQSWDRPNPDTEDTRDYCTATVIDKQHGSIAEHSSVSFYVEGVSRSLTHELVRHRHLSFSQLSQRFVSENDAVVTIPPAFACDDDAINILSDVEHYTKNAYCSLVDLATNKGLPRKQAREAARAALPNATATSLVVTGNLRAWRDVLGRRLHPSADAEIRQLSFLLLRELNALAPSLFADLIEEYADDLNA